MSIEHTESVDAIGTEISSGKVILTISDHLDWEDEGRHLLALQDKMNTYVRFIESGELLSAYPDATGRTPVTDVVARVEPARSGVQFFDQVRQTLRSAGIDLRVRVQPE